MAYLDESNTVDEGQHTLIRRIRPALGRKAKSVLDALPATVPNPVEPGRLWARRILLNLRAEAERMAVAVAVALGAGTTDAQVQSATDLVADLEIKAGVQ